MLMNINKFIEYINAEKDFFDVEISENLPLTIKLIYKPNAIINIDKLETNVSYTIILEDYGLLHNFECKWKTERYIELSDEDVLNERYVDLLESLGLLENEIMIDFLENTRLGIDIEKLWTYRGSVLTNVSQAELMNKVFVSEMNKDYLLEENDINYILERIQPIDYYSDKKKYKELFFKTIKGKLTEENKELFELYFSK
jgi:hypothetical protein